MILAAALGAIVGDNISFGIGHFLGARVERRFFSGEKAQKRLKWAQKTLEERGGYLIVVARFIPGGRTVTTFTAGFVETFPGAVPLLRRDRGRDLGLLHACCSATSAARRSRSSPGRGCSSRSGSRWRVTGVVELVRHLRHRRRASA